MATTTALKPGDPGYIAPPPTTGSGLIQTTVPGAATTATTYQPSTATAQQATSEGYDPAKYAVTSDQTVQGQLKGIIDENSPLMQQAAVRAKQDAQAKGLLNTSIAVGSGQGAVLERATPIATSDAAAYERAATNTINAKNAALQFTAGAKNTASLTNAQLGTNVNLSNAEMANKAKSEAAGFLNDYTEKMALQKSDEASKMALAKLDSQTRIQLTTIDNQYRQLLQTNQSLANMYNNTVTAIGNISTNTTMSPEAKDAAVQSQMAMLNEGLKAAAAIASTSNGAVTSLNLGQYFQPGAVAVPNAAGSQQVNVSNFDSQRYLRENPDVAQAGMDAWTHYITYGANEGRKAYSV